MTHGRSMGKGSAKSTSGMMEKSVDWHLDGYEVMGGGDWAWRSRDGSWSWSRKETASPKRKWKKNKMNRGRWQWTLATCKHTDRWPARHDREIECCSYSQIVKKLGWQGSKGRRTTHPKAGRKRYALSLQAALCRSGQNVTEAGVGPE
jgi:hypothetical protein